MITVNSILEYLKISGFDVQYIGKENMAIEGFASINEIKDNSLIWVDKNKIIKDSLNLIDYRNLLIVSNDLFETENFNIIHCENPRSVFFTILNHFWGNKKTSAISDSAIIETEIIGKNLSVGHHSFIGKDVRLGDNITIEHNVTILGKVNIGDNTIIHSGAVIGSDGYGYILSRENCHEKITHFGGVYIGANVEIGANTCIDRGTIDDTFIGDNVKIDNLCHIAHNVVIENNSMVVAMSMLAGSSIIKENAYIAPGTLVMNQVNIGESAFIGMGSVVINDVEKGMVAFGIPARSKRKV